MGAFVLTRLRKQSDVNCLNWVTCNLLCHSFRSEPRECTYCRFLVALESISIVLQCKTFSIATAKISRLPTIVTSMSLLLLSNPFDEDGLSRADHGTELEYGKVRRRDEVKYFSALFGASE